MADATKEVILKISINEKHLEILKDMQQVLEANQTIEVTLKKLMNLSNKHEVFIQPMIDLGYLIMGMSELGPYVVPSPVGGFIAVQAKGKILTPDFSV